jgi:hypothetical protein
MAYDYPNQTDIGGLLAYPTQGSPYFWLWILSGIFLIMAFTSYYQEVKIFGKGRLLSSLVVSSFFITILAVMGTLVGFVSTEILIYIVVMFSIFTAIFIFSGKEN